MSDLPANPRPAGANLPILSGAPKVKDPVCGMSVDFAKAAGRVDHSGKTYYFCSKRCMEWFKQDTERFFTAPGTAGREYGRAHAHAYRDVLADVFKQAAMQHAPAAAMPASAPRSNA